MATTINSNTTDGLVITPDTSGEVKIQSNGTDVVTFDSNGMNMASGMTIDATKLTGNLPAIDGSALTNLPTPSGTVVQVVQSYSSSPQALGANAWRDIGGLNLTITPQSASNKILLLISFNGTANDNSANTFRLLRSGTQIYGSGGTNGGFRTWGNASYMRPAIVGANFNIYDSPNTTSARNYKVQGYANNTWYINRNYGAEALAGYYGTVSMIALEIKG
jgi:hypothetical protein